MYESKEEESKTIWNNQPTNQADKEDISDAQQVSWAQELSLSESTKKHSFGSDALDLKWTLWAEKGFKWWLPKRHIVMETSKTAPLSTSRLKWALEIVTASKNCHEEEPADNNENKSQPIIAKRFESFLVLGFLIFVGSDISFSIAVSFAYFKCWMYALVIFRIGGHFQAHDSFVTSRIKRMHHLKTEKECLTTILRRNSAGLGKTAHFSITVVGFSQIWKLKFGKELVSACSQFFTKLADQELNPFSSLCHFLNRMLSQRKASESFLDNFDDFSSLPSIFWHHKAWIPILVSFCCELWRSWDVAGSRVGKQLAAAAPTSPRNPGEAVIQLGLGRLKVLLLGAIPEKLSLQSLCRKITNFQCHFSHLQCDSVKCSILRPYWLCNITVDTHELYDCDMWKVSLLWSSLGCAGCVLVPCWWLPSLAGGWCWCPTKCLKLPRGASGQCIVDQEKIVVEFTSAHCRLTQQCIVKRLIENIKLCR